MGNLAPDGKTYDILIESGGTIKGFMIVPGTPGSEKVNDFAPIIGVAGTQLTYAEGAWRPWIIQDWRGGIGQEKADDPSKFLRNSKCRTDIEGRVMAATRILDEDASVSAREGVDFGGNHYVIAGITIRKRLTATGVWSEVKGGMAATGIAIGTFGTRIFVGIGDANNGWMSTDGTTWADWGVAARAVAIWRDKMARALNYQLFLSKTPETPASWGTAIDVGDPNFDIIRMVPYNDDLYIVKEEGLYRYDGTNVQLIEPHPIFSGNGKLCIAHEGFLYYNVLNSIRKYSASGTMQDITPRDFGTEAKEIYGYGVPVGGFALPGYLYVAFDLGENTYPYVLQRRTSGIEGWSIVYQGAAAAVMNGAWFSQEADRMFLNDGTTRAQRFLSLGAMPYPDYETGWSQRSSWFDGGDPRSPKAAKAVQIEARGMSATETLTIKYYKDKSETPTTVGTVTADGETELQFDAIAGAISFKTLSIEVVGARGADTSKTPVLLRTTVLQLVRPPSVMAHRAQLRLEDTPVTLG